MKNVKFLTTLIFSILLTLSIQAQPYTDVEIQAAIDAATAGDIVTLDAATYTLSNVVNLNKDITLRGQGSASTILQVSGAGYRLNISADGASLEDLQVLKTDKTSQNIIYLGANNISILNSVFTGQFVMGDGEVSRGLEFAGGLTGILVDGNTFQSLRQPAYVNNNVGGTISNNFTEITKGWVVVTDCNLTFTGNTWGTGANVNYYDIALINQSGSVNNYPDIVTVSANNNDAIIENQHTSYAQPILSIVTVDANAVGGNNGSIIDPYTDIQSAIPRVAEGGKINVANGTYETTSQMDVNKSISIVGQGAVIIKANNPSWSTVNGQKHLIGIYAGTLVSPVTISNITMDCNNQCFGVNTYNNAYGVLSDVDINDGKGAGLTVNGSTIIATNLSTSGNAWGAVNVDPGSGVTDPTVFTLNSGNLGEDNQIWSDRSYVTGTATVTVNTPVDYSEYIYDASGVYIWTNRELTNVATISKNGETRLYSTIQSAIDVATSGDVIDVVAGNYEEQITVDGKSLTISGDGVDVTNIESPVSLNITFSTSSDNYCVVGIINDGSLILQNLTVNGLGRGNGNYKMMGVGFRNSAGSVDNCKIINIEETPFSGAQHGVALYSYNSDGISRTISVTDSYFENFQKNAFALNADDLTPLIVSVSGNQIMGKGATSVTAQNGVQTYGKLISGTVENNTITGIGYSGASWVASSILSYFSGVDFVNNTINSAQVGIYCYDGFGDLSGNDITVNKIGDYSYGIIATDPEVLPSPFGGENKSTNGIIESIELATLVVTVNNNIITFDGVDKTSSYGIEADAGYGTDDIDITANGNTVNGFEYGILTTEGTSSTGVFTNMDFRNNTIINNDIGFYSNVTYMMANAENSWWGTAVESEIQALIDGDVDYDPWVGKAETQTASGAVPLTLNFPTSGVDITFNTLPVGGGTVTVQRYNEAPSGYPAPPAGATNAGLWLDITSSMPNYSFSADVSVDVTGLGFDASTSIMYFNSTTNSWVAVNNGTYAAGPPEKYTFTTNHFTPFSFINTPATAYNIYLASSPGAAASSVIYPNDAWATTPNEPNDWGFTSPIELYIVPEPGSFFGSAEIVLQWDNTLYTFAGVDESGGLFDGISFQFLYNQLGAVDQVTINASRLDNGNFTTVNGDYICKLQLNVEQPGFGPIDFTAMDFRAFDGAGSFDGVYVVGNSASVKSYLGDVASPGDESTGDGLIDLEDLSLWTGSYWSGVPGYTGPNNYKVKYDVGPTADNTVFTLPDEDGMIQFEDMVIFAISYGFSGDNVYPKAAPAPETPVELIVGEPMYVGNETLVPLSISGSVVDVRAMELAFSGSFGKLLGVEKGALLQNFDAPVVLMDKSTANSANVDMAIFGADVEGLNAEGEILTLRFEGRADVQLSSASVRNSGNNSMKIEISNSNISAIPTSFALDQNYPNPFNPSTIISFQLPEQRHVSIAIFNMLGEEVSTLVNEVKEAGYHKVEWSGTNLTSGVYFYRIEAGDFVSVKKMMLMK